MDNRRSFLKKIGVTAIAAVFLPSIKANSDSLSELEGIDELDCDPTTLDYYGEGPFYTEGAPNLVEGSLADESEEGERLIISGSVYTDDCETKIPGALIDLWHANDAGQYDNSGFNLRGKINSDDNGDYIYQTILPGKYLNGANYRPRHIHIKVSSEGFNSLTTQMYFEGDTDIPGDAAASINSGTYNASDRIISIVWNEKTEEWEGSFDMILQDTSTGLNEEILHIHFGMIQSINPNPVKSSSEIRFSVFKDSHVKIDCFDMDGKRILNIVNEKMKAGKYENSIGLANLNSVSGTYVLQLNINGMSVHSKKFVVS